MDNIIKWCIYSIVFAAPFSKSISEVAIALAIAMWALKKALNSDFALKADALTVPFLIFVAGVIPSLFVSAYPLLSLRAFFTKLLKFVLLYFVIVDEMDTRDKLKDLFAIALISMAVIMLDGFVQYYYSGVDGLRNYPSFKTRPPSDMEGFYRGFPTASFPFPNDLAAWILLVLLPLGSLAMFGLKNGWLKVLTASVSLGLLYLFFLTKARGAWLGLILSALYIAVLKKKLWILAALLIILTVVPFVFRMEMAHYIFAFGSIGDRFVMWKTGWDIFKAHPVIGNGLNTFFLKFKEYRHDEYRDKKGSYAHNCYLQMASDVGVVGLGGFLWLVYSYFSYCITSLKAIKDGFYGSVLWGLSIGVFAFLVHSFFDTNLYSLNLATLFWCAIGISSAIAKVCAVPDMEAP